MQDLSHSYCFSLLHPLFCAPAAYREQTPKQEHTADVDQQVLKA
jgi:hypothetical protein